MATVHLIPVPEHMGDEQRWAFCLHTQVQHWCLNGHGPHLFPSPSLQSSHSNSSRARTDDGKHDKNSLAQSAGSYENLIGLWRCKCWFWPLKKRPMKAVCVTVIGVMSWMQRETGADGMMGYRLERYTHPRRMWAYQGQVSKKRWEQRSTRVI